MSTPSLISEGLICDHQTSWTVPDRADRHHRARPGAGGGGIREGGREIWGGGEGAMHGLAYICQIAITVLDLDGNSPALMSAVQRA